MPRMVALARLYYMGISQPAQSAAELASAELDRSLRSSRRQLVALAYSLTGSRGQAEDVVQEVHARLLRADISAASDLHAYARRAVCNESFTWGRRITHGLRRAQALEAERERDLRCEPDPFGRAEIMSALAALPPRPRAAVILRYYLAMNDAEIGEALGCAPTTVRSLLSRAMARLREELGDRPTDSTRGSA